MKLSPITALFVCFAASAYASDQSDASRACISGKSADATPLNAARHVLVCTDWLNADPAARSLALVFRAEAYEKQQDWAKAFQDYSDIVQLTPENPSAWYNRGVLRLRYFGQADAAIADFDAAIDLTQDRLRPRYFLHRAAAYGQLFEAGQLSKVDQLSALGNIRTDLETYLSLTEDQAWQKKGRAAANEILVYVTARLEAWDRP